MSGAGADDHGHAHAHAHGHDHGHDDDHDDGPDLPLEENPLWQQDNVVLHSVGVDIGSSGTQVAFSRLHLRRLAENLTSRYVVVRRETHFQSEVVLTPFTADLLIDAAELGAFLDRAYAQARIVPADVDTGGVILTGEALRRRNAELIAEVVAERAGDLVCATAGHHMEAMLAAHGSGAVRVSRELHGRILNVDIGGGTTKLTVVEDGRIVATAAFHVGGRLIAVEDGAVTRLEPGGARHARDAGTPLSLGDRPPDGTLEAIGRHMAQVLLDVLGGDREAYPQLWLTDPLPDPGRLDGVIFSGGVAEYVYGTQSRDFGDLGPHLGAALAQAAGQGRLPAPLLPADARIRATVLGAAQYTVQLSGITSYLGAPERTLPRRNLPVARPDYALPGVVDAAAVGDRIRRHVARFDPGPDKDMALALHWTGDPEYPRLRALAEAVLKGLADRIAGERTVYLMLDGDVGRTLGRLLRDELGLANDLVVLDGVALGDFDYVDLGRVRQPSGTVAVTIKSLVFSSSESPSEPASDPGG